MAESEIIIKAQNTASAEIKQIISDTQRLADEVTKLASTAGSGAPELKKVATELGELAQQQRNLSQFKQLQAELDASSRTLDNARAATKRLKDEISATKGPTDALNAELSTAQAIAGEAAQANSYLRQQLNSLGRELNENNVNTRNLDQAQQLLTAKMGRARDEAQSLQKQFDSGSKATSRFAGFMRSAASDADSLKNKLGGVKTQIAAFVASALSFVGVKKAFTDVFTTSSQFEDLETQLKALTGSSEKAKVALDWIENFTQNTPLQLEQTTNGFVRLKSFGLDPMDGTLQSLVDQNAKLGGSNEKLQGIILAVGQAWAKGKLQAEETLQLVERGVPVYDLLQKALGKTAGQIEDMSAKGELGRDVIKKLIQAMGDDALGDAAQQMDDARGIISNLKDIYVSFLDEIGEQGVFEYLKGELKEVLSRLKAMEADGTLKDWAKRISDSMITAAEAVKSTIQFVRDFGGEIKAAAATVVAFKLGGLVIGMYASATATGAATTAINIFKSALIRTGVGALVVGLGYLVAKFVDTADAAEGAADKLDKSTESSKKANDVYQEIAESTGIVIESQDDLARAINDGTIAWDSQTKGYVKAGEETNKLIQASRTLSEDISDLAGKERLLAEASSDSEKAAIGFVYQLDEMKKSADGLDESLAKLKESDFASFANGLAAALDQGYITAADSAQISNAVLLESFDRLNISAEQLASGMTEAGAESVAALNLISRSASVSGEVLAEALNNAIDTAKTESALNRIKAQLDQMGEAGRLSATQIADATAAIDAKFASLNDGLSVVSKNVVTKFRDLVNSAEVTGEQISQAITDGLSTIDTKAGIDAIKNELEQLQREGKISLQQLFNEFARLDKAAGDLRSTLEIARESLGNITNDFNAASTISEMDKVGVSATKAWQQGKISAEQYQAVLLLIEQKKRDIINATFEQIEAEREAAAAAQATAQAQADSAASAAKAIVNYNTSVYENTQAIELSNRALENQQKIQESLAQQRKEILANAAKAGTQEATLRAIAELNLLWTKSANEMAKANREAVDLADRVNDIGDASLDTKKELEDYAKTLEAAINNDELLNDQNFDKLKRSLEQVNREIDQINNAAKSAISEMQSLESQLASLNGDDLTVEKIEYEQKRLSLVEKLTEAEAAGNDSAVESYKQSLSILKQIHDIKMKDIEAAKKSAAETSSSRASTNPETTSPRPQTSVVGNSRTVRIDFGDSTGKTVSGVFEEDDVDHFLTVLSKTGAATA